MTTTTPPETPGEVTRPPGRWVMPAWMEWYRDLIGNTGGNTIESLMNDTATTAQSNPIRSALIVSVESQIGLLMRLHSRGLLAAPSRQVVSR